VSVGRVVAAAAASVAVAGCAAVAIGMSQAADPSGAVPPGTPTSQPVERPVVLPMTRVALSPTPAGPAPSTAVATRSTPRSTPHSLSSSAAQRTAPPTSRAAAPAHHAPPRPGSRPAVIHPAPGGQPLPLRIGTGSATQVITVTARSASSTTATLQAWTKVAGGWREHGSPVTAHVGADGLSNHPSEWRSATPIGSFTLTQAFGRNADPGTALPYFKTSPADWWISQTTGTGARYYNTHQHCSARCSFVQGDPNEHLYYETPYYNYAAVIDYNTRNAPGGVHLGAGSAFFLHVTDGRATAGCVAIPQLNLVALLRWLRPSGHPRILIGVR
jgi:L,D-peptidoglycan transpeptidase YkuD (ErfK/YbiS/YcfS/YnhG family)